MTEAEEAKEIGRMEALTFHRGRAEHYRDAAKTPEGKPQAKFWLKCSEWHDRAAEAYVGAIRQERGQMR